MFAYVKNISKSGAYYWVFAHVTPSYSKDGQIIVFHSNRRVPERRILDGVIIPLYAEVLREEAKHRNGKEALAAGFKYLVDFVSAKRITDEELIFSLQGIRLRRPRRAGGADWRARRAAGDADDRDRRARARRRRGLPRGASSWRRCAGSWRRSAASRTASRAATSRRASSTCPNAATWGACAISSTT